jgi:hypothetical protein
MMTSATVYTRDSDTGGVRLSLGSVEVDYPNQMIKIETSRKDLYVFPIASVSYFVVEGGLDEQA